MRDYAKNSEKRKIKKPAATRKTPKVAVTNDNPQKTTYRQKSIVDNPKKTIRKKLDAVQQAARKLKSSESTTIKPPYKISQKTQSKVKVAKKQRAPLSLETKKRITSLGVFSILGLITVLLLGLLLYVMTHKKTTPVTEISIPKPQLPLSGGKAEIIHIPIGSNNSTDNTQAAEIKPISENQNSVNSTQLTDEQTANISKPITDQETASPKFTFYDSLSNQTVKVDATPKTKIYQYTYMLQVASYKNKNDANSMRARLLLLGMKPTVEQKGSYYVVSVGPVSNKRDGDILKHKLEANKIQGSMLIQTDKTLITQPNEHN